MKKREETANEGHTHRRRKNGRPKATLLPRPVVLSVVTNAGCAQIKSGSEDTRAGK